MDDRDDLPARHRLDRRRQGLAVDTLTPCTETDQDQCPLWTSPSAVDALLEVPARSLATVVPGMPVAIEEQP